MKKINIIKIIGEIEIIPNKTKIYFLIELNHVIRGKINK